jgi:heat shock protein HslJ
MKFLALTILSLTLLVGCKSNKQQDTFAQKIYFVNSTRVACEGVGEMQCLQIQKGNTMKEGNWENFSGTIEGFDYTPGYLYKIVVKEEKLDPKSVAADASNIKYTLVNTLMQKGDDLLNLNDIWALREINGKNLQLTDGNKQPVLEINIAEKRINGNDSCNSMFGDIETLGKKKISFGKLGSTLMACEDMKLSEEYKVALEGVASYERKGLNLSLMDAEGNEILKFRKVD